jgi:4'-phosphopantetheinyl transferase
MKMVQQTGRIYNLHSVGTVNGTDQFIPQALHDTLSLDDHEVHVWLASLRSTSAIILDLWDTLADDEKQRALRFRFQKDCDRFIVARGLLRAILGRYLNRVPAQIEFEYNEFGKPSVLEVPGGRVVNFNVSHTDELALFAFTRCGKVGVDIETMRTDLIDDRVAEQFFSIREQSDLKSLNVGDRERDRAFFNCWTRKEAFVKARGQGLSLALDQFDVSVLPDQHVSLLEIRDGETAASDWSLREILVGDNHVAAIAVESNDWELHCWKLSS